MKFSSLFNNLPKHRQFNYTPRVYDPGKEDLKVRTKRIERQVNAVSNSEELDSELTFHHKRKAYNSHTNKLRLIIASVLLVLLLLYLTN